MMGSVQEPYSSWEEGHVAAEHGNITSEVAADQVQQRDVSKENDPSHIWSDTEDSPLKVGREYKMASPSYDIPDIIRVTAIKPESIEIKITSEFGIDSRTEISYQDVEMEGLTFEPYEHGDDQDLPEEDAIYNDSTSGDETDLTNSAQMFAKSAGYSYSQSEQRDFINEQGSARNADKLDLSNTHYRTESEDDDFLFGW
jgi:hypothetical protein